MKMKGQKIDNYITDWASMKIVGSLNTFTLAGISLLWGQMLGHLNLWFTPLTVLCLLISYGSELNQGNAGKKKANLSL